MKMFFYCKKKSKINEISLFSFIAQEIAFFWIIQNWVVCHAVKRKELYSFLFFMFSNVKIDESHGFFYFSRAHSMFTTKAEEKQVDALTSNAN